MAIDGKVRKRSKMTGKQEGAFGTVRLAAAGPTVGGAALLLVPDCRLNPYPVDNMTSLQPNRGAAGKVNGLLPRSRVLVASVSTLSRSESST